MRKELDYFYIEGAVGGNQEWFRNVVMYMGGCAAATACDCCIYLAKHGEKQLYPYDISQLSKEDYINFSMKMKPYLRPRMSGINRTDIFIEGFEKYLQDNGEMSLRLKSLEGTRSWQEAAAFIKEQIDAGFPVPYLMLRHKNDGKYKDFIWHWFLCIGYEDVEEDLNISVATYGEGYVFSLKDLWDTGHEEKGGLVGWERQAQQVGEQQTESAGKRRKS